MLKKKGIKNLKMKKKKEKNYLNIKRNSKVRKNKDIYNVSFPSKNYIGQISILYTNYQNRVKEFITDMTNPEHKIIIKDISKKVNNTRNDLMKDNIIRKPFIFKGYKSEEDRIKDAAYKNKLLYNIPDYPSPRSNNTKKDNDNDNNNNKDKSRNIIYNFNIDIQQRYNTTNDNDNVNNKISSKLVDSKKKVSMSDVNIFHPKRKNSIYNLKNGSESNNQNIRLTIFEKKLLKDLSKNNSIYQPQMRYKPRTDLERVYDILNLQSLMENDRQVIERQLTNIDLYSYKRPKDILEGKKEKKIKVNRDGKTYNILPNPIILEQKKKLENIQHQKAIYGNRNLFYEPKNNDNKLWARKENLNLEAKKLLSLYHYKTHFKATEEIQFKIKQKPNSTYDNTELNKYLMIPNLFNTISSEKIPKISNIINLKKNQFRNKSYNNYDLNYSELDKKEDLFNFGEDAYKSDEEIDDYEYNKLFQNNPNLKFKSMKPNSNSMKNLFNLAFKKGEKTEEDNKRNSHDNNNYRYSRDFMENRKHGNYIVDDKNIHDVAKLVLDECHVNSSKSKYNNTSLKTRSGKTMITKGLSVDEFLKKHCLSEQI